MSVTGRPERIVFWPDPRGVVQRQLAGMIARRDQSVLEPASLAKKSAALQGLTALEVLLTDEAHPLGSDVSDEGRYRCRLAVAVAQSIANLAGEMVGEWDGPDGWRKRMLEPGPQNATYKTAAEPPADFARGLITGLQMLQDRQVVPLITANAAPGKPARLAFARSDLGARYVAAGVESLKGLYEAMGLDRNVAKDKAWMPQWITMAFKRLARDGPAAVERNGTHGEARARELRMLRFHVEGIRKLVGRELAPNAGLMIGFNELDGD
jgi:predicted lipoprotein